MGTGSARITEHSVTQSIAAIYEAAAAPDRWTTALQQLREMFALASTAYLIHSADRTKIDRVTAEVDPEGHRANVEILLRESVFYRRGNAWNAGQVMRTAEMIPTQTFLRSRMYQEYWRPRGLWDGLRLTIAVDRDGVNHGLNLLRPRSIGPFEESEIAVARALIPHLRRAVELRRRLNHADMLTSAAQAALDAQRHGILLLDQNGQLLRANAEADALLRDADGLGATGGMLHAASAAATNRLRGILAGAAGVPPRGGTLRLPRPNGRSALALLAMPFRADAHWSLPRRPAVLVCVTDPDLVATLPGRQMAELFGLTGAEAALATDLLTGEGLREIADRRGRAIATVRSQLAGLMAKTHVNRQSDLLRLLGSLPRLRDLN